MSKRNTEIVLRPYELIEIVTRLGAGKDPSDLGDARLTGILKVIMDNPRIRVRFRSYHGRKYTGHNADAPHGVAQTLLWDKEIVHRLYPGETVQEPVTTGFSALSAIAGADLEELCAAAKPATPAWNGLPGVTPEDFQRGREKIKKLLHNMLPCRNRLRTDEEREGIRRTTAEAIEASDCIRLFPSHVLYVIAYYGKCSEILQGRVYAQDSMYEVGVAMRRQPDRPVMLVPEHCMLCPTCRGYDQEGPGLCGARGG